MGSFQVRFSYETLCYRSVRSTHYSPAKFYLPNRAYTKRRVAKRSKAELYYDMR